jgi:hypothetical protein
MWLPWQPHIVFHLTKFRVFHLVDSCFIMESDLEGNYWHDSPLFSTLGSEIGSTSDTENNPEHEGD